MRITAADRGARVCTRVASIASDIPPSETVANELNTGQIPTALLSNQALEQYTLQSKAGGLALAMAHQNLLRTTLSANAGFSAASGLVLTIAPDAIGRAIGVEADWLLTGFGVVLLAHAVILWIVVSKFEIERWAKLNLAALVPYPLLMVVVAAAVADAPDGRALVLADGLAIAFLGAALFVGLRSSADVT